MAQNVFPAWKRCTVWGGFFLQLSLLSEKCAPNAAERAGADTGVELRLPLWPPSAEQRPLLWVFGDSGEGDRDSGASSLCPAQRECALMGF